MVLDVVIPTLNSEKTLGATLESLRPFSGSVARVLVVDSYSSDRTLQIVKSHGYEHISIAPGNMYAAINAGIRMGSCPWCTYINSDDLLFADVIIESLEQDGFGADLLYGNIDFIDLHGRFIASWNSPRPEDLLPLAKRHINPVPQQGMLFRRSLWTQLNGFDETFLYSADYHFVSRALLERCRFHRIDKARVAAFRIHGSQFSQKCSAQMAKEADRVMRTLQSARVSDSLYLGAKARVLFRLNNTLNYLMRILRHKQLRGSYKIPRTICRSP